MEHLNLNTYMDKHGRILIPAEVRKELQFSPGDKFILQVIDNELKVMSLNHAIDEMHALFVKNRDPKGKAVEEFLESKKIEFELEKKRRRNLSE